MSAAGVGRIFDRGTRLRRFIWLMVICGTFFVMCYMTYQVIKEYMEYKKIVEQTSVIMSNMEFPAVTICSLTKFKSANIKPAGIAHLQKLQQFLESVKKLPSPSGAINACSSNPACEWSWFHNHCRCLSNPCEAEFCGNGYPKCPCSSILCSKYPKLCSTSDDQCSCLNNSNYKKFWKKSKKELSPIHLPDIDVTNLLRTIREAEVEDLSDIDWVFQPDLLSIANYGSSFDSLVISCSFQKERCDQRNFTVMYTPLNGKCYTFNYAGKLPKKQQRFITHTKRYGWNSGLQLYMQAESNQTLDFMSKDIGVRVVVHDPLQLPHVSEYGLIIKPGDSTAIQIEREQINRLAKPWGRCLQTGKHLAFNYTHQPYSQLGCKRYCQNFYIKRNCNCIKRSLIPPSIKRPTERELNEICNFSKPIQKQCADEVIKLIENDTIHCSCEQACKENIFHISLSFGAVNQDYFRLVKLANTLKDIGNNTFGAASSEDKTNILGLKVYYRTLTLQTTTESPAYSWETLIANIGGNLGFFMGLTLVAVYEFLELGIDSIVLLLQRNK